MKKQVIAVIMSLVVILGIFPLLSPQANAQGNNITTISSGGFHSLSIKNDGTLWSWGRNQYGQVGDGTTVNRSAPIQVLKGTIAVSAGWSHSLALKTDGTLWVWGHNGYGQLGDGTISDRYIPVQIMSDVKQISAGDTHTMILKTDGTLWACGNNYYGQLGDGSTTTRNKPIQIMSEVIAVSAGENHTMAIKTDNTLWSWGRNDSGELGDGTSTSTSTPKKIMSGITFASAGGRHSLAIKADGTLWAWGSNYYGQLGDGAKISNFIGDANPDRSTPVNILSEVAYVSAGDSHTMILKTDGTLWACGYNYHGQLGYGSSDTLSTPVLIERNIAAASAGAMHSMAVKTDGTLYTWGNNDFGQLGDKTYTQRTSPLQVMNNVATATPTANNTANPSNGNTGLSNFVKVNTYTIGKFTDVPEDSWFHRNVATAYELGLMLGTSNTYFNANGNISIAETIALACRLHSKYYADREAFASGTPWYKTYIDYALKNSIITATFSDYNKAASRAEFASILSKSLPDEALSVINVVNDNDIPDVLSTYPYASGVYRLYRAGVLVGSDSSGTFNPNTMIGRAEAATIVTRMASENLRKTIVFVPKLVSIEIEQNVFIAKNETHTLQVTPIPNDAKINSVTWISSDNSIATVTNGVVTGVKYGVVNITAQTTGGGFSNCKVTVGPQIDYDNVTFSDSLNFFFFIIAVMPDSIQTPMGTVETAIQVSDNSFYSISPTYELKIKVRPMSVWNIFNINNTPGYSIEEKTETIKILKDYQYKIYQYADHYFPNAKLMGSYLLDGYTYEYIREGYHSSEFALWSNFSNMPQIDKTSPKSYFRWCE